MRKVVFAIALAVLVALPAASQAQVAGACLFSGGATIASPGIGVTPVVGHGFSFSGPVSDPGGGACGFPGNVNASGTLNGGCAGNVHQGSASTPVGGVDFAGVCVGALCTGVAYTTTPAGFVYVLAFDADTITRASEDCPTDEFRDADFDGVAVGGSA